MVKDVLTQMEAQRKGLADRLDRVQPWEHVVTPGNCIHYVGINPDGSASVVFNPLKAYTTASGNAKRIAEKFHALTNDGRRIDWKVMSLTDALTMEIEGLDRVLNLLKSSPVKA